ncbi:MAG TPA: ABC transporter substrate-binding protein [Candidatus Angelobacter sp.]|jgi:putative ABC transport system substrate-binding protein|nr:ABC transporter substrate-binding protein [Candidatus Angelobacter sp.]
MDRRVFLGTLAAGLLAAPLATEAQSAGKAPRIGVLSGSYPDNDGCLEVLRSGFSDLGYREGQTYSLEIRLAEGRLDFSRLAPDLVKTKPALIVTFTGGATKAAKQATDTIPIVMAVGVYPVEEGLIASLARPGGNVTGMAVFSPGLMAKCLQLLQEAVPGASRIAALRVPDRSNNPMVEEAEKAAVQLGLRLHMIDVQRPEELSAAFQTAVRGGAQAIMSTQAPFSWLNRFRMAELALKHRLPSLSCQVNSAEAGTLLFYGPSIRESCRRAAAYVDKVLKGTKPADLPVEQPTTFELVINLKTAKALGLTIPPSLLQRADEVIQ